jgi:hypothetical protein
VPLSNREIRTPFRLRPYFDSDGVLKGTVTVLKTNRTTSIRRRPATVKRALSRLTTIPVKIRQRGVSVSSTANW